MRSRITVALLGTLVMAGCGLTSSPARDVTFTAPAGWQASPGILGFMQFWRPPGNGDEVLMLFRAPKQESMQEIFSTSNMKDSDIIQRRTIRICHNQAAEYVRAQGTIHAIGDTGVHVNGDAYVQLVGTNAGGKAYFAMYVYPKSRLPSAQAVAALRELCPKS
jgi:hypothetical protein